MRIRQNNELGLNGEIGDEFYEPIGLYHPSYELEKSISYP